MQLWATVATSLEEDAATEIQATLQCELTKTLMGQVLFKVADADLEATAAGLLRLRTVDYVHVLLASTQLTAAESSSAVNDENIAGERALRSIRGACSEVGPDEFAGALALWREVKRRSGDEELAALPRDALVFRTRGKRGGRGHGFSSDEAKRAAGRGLKQATGLPGSTTSFHLDLMAQVHGIIPVIAQHSTA